MKTVDYIVNGTYKSVRVNKDMTSNELYLYLLRKEKNTFVIRRVIYE